MQPTHRWRHVIFKAEILHIVKCKWVFLCLLQSDIKKGFQMFYCLEGLIAKPCRKCWVNLYDLYLKVCKNNQTFCCCYWHILQRRYSKCFQQCSDSFQERVREWERKSVNKTKHDLKTSAYILYLNVAAVWACRLTTSGLSGEFQVERLIWHGSVDEV